MVPGGGRKYAGSMDTRLLPSGLDWLSVTSVKNVSGVLAARAIVVRPARLPSTRGVATTLVKRRSVKDIQ